MQTQRRTLYGRVRTALLLTPVLALALVAPTGAIASKGKSSDHKPAGAGIGHRIR
jgi:hypothetical protein